MMKFLQKLGKSLMLPVSVLPICGILMGIGYRLCPAVMQGGSVEGLVAVIGFILVKAGSAVIDNMAWLFVIGVSVGMADDSHGAAALAGLVSWLVITTLLSKKVISAVYPASDSTLLALEQIQNPFIAILTGLTGASCYNRFKGQKLPEFLAFFSGRRFVIIITAVVSIMMAAVLFVVWPLLFAGLSALGRAILGLGGIGAGIYAFLNRLLIPFGLHHAVNNVVWFDTVGIGDLTAFWAGKTSEEVGWSLGMYMSGFFPCIMFGIPGAALAMVKNARNKKKTLGQLLPIAFCAFLCGVTEPFDFSFVYSAFPLYMIYSVLYGLFTYVTYLIGFRAGFSFSAGAVDLLFSSSMPAAQKVWLIVPLGIAAFAVFFIVFDICIRVFDAKTPGRSDTDDPTPAKKLTDDEKAARIVAALGGKDNISSVDCCATRLRITLKDSSRVDKGDCRAAGVLGVTIPDASSCQLIIGVTVQQLLNAVKEYLAGNAEQPQHRRVTHNEALVSIPIPAATHCVSAITAGENGLSFTYTVTDPLGMHARPAAALAGLVSGYDCTVTLENGERSADVSGTIGVMALGIVKGSTVRVTASGKDAAAALAAVEQHFKREL